MASVASVGRSVAGQPTTRKKVAADNAAIVCTGRPHFPTMVRISAGLLGAKMTTAAAGTGLTYNSVLITAGGKAQAANGGAYPQGKL